MMHCLANHSSESRSHAPRGPDASGSNALRRKAYHGREPKSAHDLAYRKRATVEDNDASDRRDAERHVMLAMMITILAGSWAD